MAQGTFTVMGVDDGVGTDMAGDAVGGIRHVAEPCRAMIGESRLKAIGMGMADRAILTIKGDVTANRGKGTVFTPVRCLRMTDLTDAGGCRVYAGTTFVKGKGVLAGLIQKAHRGLAAVDVDSAADKLPVDDRKRGGGGDVGEGGGGITGDLDGAGGRVVNGNNTERIT